MDEHTFPLTLTEQDTIFTDLTLYEWVDKPTITTIINNKSFNTLEKSNEIYNGLKKIKKSSKKQDYITCKYHRHFPYGRVYPDQYSYIKMPKVVRHTIAYKKYVDIDIVNCIPTILNQVIKSNRLQNRYLQEYIDNREDKLKELQTQFGISRNEAKNLVIKVINGSTEKINENEYLKNLSKEISFFVNMINNCNPVMKEALEKYKKSKKKKKDNIEYSLFTQFLFEYENRILECIYTYLDKNKFIKNNYITLCYDGIMFVKTKKKIVLKDIEDYIKKKTHFLIKLSIKEMNKIKDIDKSKSDSDIDQLLKKEFDKYSIIKKLTEEQKNDFIIDFFENILGQKEHPLNYALMKRYFLKHFVFILRENGIYRIKKEYKYIKKNSDNYYVEYKLIRYEEKGLKRVLMKNDEGDYVSFFDKLLEEPYKKYDSVVFEPNKEDDNYYNMFDGFGYTKIECDVKDNDKRLFQIYLDYIKKYFCSDNKKKYHNLMCYLGNILQNPEGKPHKCIVLYSSVKGCGKSCFGNMVSSAIGNKYCFFGDATQLFKDHSTINQFRFFVFIDEFKKSTTLDNIQQFKSLITTETSTINQKFKDIIYDNPDYCRYMIAIDNTERFKIERKNRRFEIFKIEPILNDDDLKKAINKINTTKRNVISKLFGDYLMNYEIDIDWIERELWADRRIQPECYNEFIRTDSIEDFFVRIYEFDFDDINKYLEDCDDDYYKIKKKDVVYINTSKLYDSYKLILGGRYYKKKSELKKFFLKKENYFIKDVKNSNNYWIVDLKLLYKYLKENKIIHNNIKFTNYWIKKVKEHKEKRNNDDSEDEDEEIEDEDIIIEDDDNSSNNNNNSFFKKKKKN